MNILALLVLIFIIAFVVLPIFCYYTRIESKSLARLCPQGYRNCNRNRHRQRGAWQQAGVRRVYNDRQGNIFTIANESSSNPLPHRCTDFFYVEPSSEDAARIRAQLEKDEKDLPTYEEVMAMSAAQVAAGTLSPPPTAASSTTIAITDATVPPYSEIDRNTTRAAPLTLEGGATAWPTGNETAPSPGAGAASTSRAAAAAATSAPTTTTVVTIANSVSNTSV